MRCSFQIVDGWAVCERSGCPNKVRADHPPLPADRYVAICRCETCPKPPKRRRGLGSRIAFGLAALGITQPRYLKLKQRLGLSPECSCKKREAWLNRLGERVARWWAKPVSKIVHAAEVVRASCPSLASFFAITSFTRSISTQRDNAPRSRHAVAGSGPIIPAFPLDVDGANPSAENPVKSPLLTLVLLHLGQASCMDRSPI
jgi:hypothetical protein